jgi:hypothetical protein
VSFAHRLTIGVVDFEMVLFGDSRWVCDHVYHHCCLGIVAIGFFSMLLESVA